MKSFASVLLPPATRHIEAVCREVLEPHRLDEDDIESIRSHHWDYWYLPSGSPLGDRELAERFPEESPKILENAAHLRNLPDDYETSAVISTDLGWVDLQDEGWRMMDGNSRNNRQAIERWESRVKELFAERPDHICVRVVLHG